MVKNILFITGTRADFGKLKALIRAVEDHPDLFKCEIFITGMHMLKKYGMTSREVERSGFSNVFCFMNQSEGDPMDMILANTIEGLGRYLDENQADLIVVHGDRVEALAAAIVGALRNIRVAHIEGGEVSGTIDESLRHAISKLSHIHFVATDVASNRLMQLGESPGSIFNIGSPDIDVMMSSDLPSLKEVKQRYEIEYSEYAICMLHPVTTISREDQTNYINSFVDAIVKSNLNYVVIYPNNDRGCELIFNEYQRLNGLQNFKLFPSIRFEYFLTLLKNARFIIGNSSAGLYEAPVYGIPTLNVGDRQIGRYKGESVFDLRFDTNEILTAIHDLEAKQVKRFEQSSFYGSGQSACLFISELTKEEFWSVPLQKQFFTRRLFND